MERRFKQIRAQVASRFMGGRGRTVATLAAVLFIGTITSLAIRQSRLAHDTASSLEQTSCLALPDDVPYEADALTLADPSPLVGERWRGRVGSQQNPLHPVRGAVVLEPAQGADNAVTSESEAPVSTEWLASILKPGGARHFSDILTTSPSTTAASEAGHVASSARSWDRGDAGPSLGPTGFERDSAATQPSGTADTSDPEELTSVIDKAADEAPPSGTPKAGRSPAEQPPTMDDAPPKSEETKQPTRPSLIDAVYAGQISRLLRPIAQVNTSMTPPAGQYDPDIPDKDERPRRQRAIDLFAKEPIQVHGPGGVRTRPWPEQVGVWEAPGIAYHPLYFEEVNLERYGYSFGLAQPVVSAAHFFGRIPALPYLMTVDPPHRCVYTLGHYRPGSCAPLAWNIPPFDPLAAAVEGGVATGLVYLIP